MQPFIELNAHHIGNSHIQNNLTCEDYSATYSDENVSIIVISDGHGDKNCFRSDKGAKYACEIAISLCRQFQSITSHIDNIEHCDFDGLVSSLEADIADRWKETVLSDAATHPFLSEELSVATKQAQEMYNSGQRLEKAYGCTLIISMVTANYWLAIQIGDGKCIAAFTDGVFIEPVPADENCLGNRSTSLCNSNSKEAFRHFYSNIMPVGLFVSSDGIEESFDAAGLYNLFYSVAYWLKEEGYNAAKEKLENLLPQISEGGSGDDVSVALLVSTQELLSKPRQTLEQVNEKVNIYSNALEQCTIEVADIQDRIKENKQECMKVESVINSLREELSNKEGELKSLLEEQEDINKKSEEASLRLQHASEQMEKANKYKLAAEKYWLAELEKIGLVRLFQPELLREPLIQISEQQEEEPPDEQEGSEQCNISHPADQLQEEEKELLDTENQATDNCAESTCDDPSQEENVYVAVCLDETFDSQAE